MEKEILTRGYVTHALTDGESKIFGMVKDQYINDWSHEAKALYWSEVYVEPGCMSTIIRKGSLLVEHSNEELSKLHEQSKVNLH